MICTKRMMAAAAALAVLCTVIGCGGSDSVTNANTPPLGFNVTVSGY